MKTARYVVVAMGLVLLLSSCFMSNPWLAGDEGDSADLPPDVIQDTTRSGSEPFQFETLLPVALNLQIDFYEAGPSGLQPAEFVPAAGQTVVVITNSKGNVVYEGAVDADGALNTQLVLPADPEDMILTVKAQGYQDRSVAISDLVNYAKIDREMGLISDGLVTKGQILPDSDGDLIPDAYDAFPNNSEYAFSLHVPDEQPLTVAYEDLYLIERAGDADYNDFVANYSIEEIYGSDGEEDPNLLKKIKITATAKEKIAGYNHLFGIAVGYEKEDGDDFHVTIEATYQTKYGSADVSFYPYENIIKPADSTYKNKAIVPLFLSTSDAIGKTATCTIDFGSGIERDKVELPPFDPFLYVYNTQYDIHLIGKDALPCIPGITHLKSDAGGTYNFMDDEGFPWALLVPTDWQSPAETQFIEELYPFFKDWRKNEGETNSDWYLYPMDPNNQPPFPVSMIPSAVEFVAGSAEPQERELLVKLGDPDGDPVTLHWSEPPNYMTIDGTANTKPVVSVVNAPAGEVTINFWSTDIWGASSEDDPFGVTFTFVEGTKLYERIVIDTFSPNGSFTADTYIDLFGEEGDPDADDPWTENDTSDAIAWADNGNPEYASMARIDYTGGLEPGTYYIRVRGASEAIRDFYAIRVVEVPIGAPLPPYDYPGLATRPDSYEVDDFPKSGGIPENPVPISLEQTISRSLYPDPSVSGGDIDWFVLKLE